MNDIPDQPTSPATVQPVPVHVTSIDAALSLDGTARHRKIVTQFKTYILTSTNPVRNILPEDPTRIQASISPHAPVGSSANSTAYGWLGSSRGEVTAAAGNDTEMGGYITAAASPPAAPIIIRGQNPVWAALDTNAATTLVLTVAIDSEV
jgi:hypothetical protein